jgi:uncharacterized membrane protein
MKQVFKNRVELLTDGIFAVVMTLLVLEISVPQISSSHDAIDSAAAGTELLSRLFDLWPNYLVLRLVLQYWPYFGWLITDYFITLNM